MMTSWNGNIFRWPVDSLQKGPWLWALTFFYLRLNKRLSKPSTRRWFETPARAQWSHCNEPVKLKIQLVPKITPCRTFWCNFTNGKSCTLLDKIYIPYTFIYYLCAPKECNGRKQLPLAIEWWHDTEMLSALFALREGNLLVGYRWNPATKNQ